MPLNQFFELLRSGLWNIPADTRLFKDTPIGWQEIYRLSREQTVMGLVFDGINTLPAELRPPRGLYLQWCTVVAQIEDANRHLNQVATELFALYRSAGVKPVLLKGQGVAINYPKPEHRQPGDIDIFVGNTNYMLANETLINDGANQHPTGTYKHTSFDYRHVEIENHRIAAMLRNPVSDRRFRRWTKKKLPEYVLTVNLPGAGPVQIPPATFNTMYLLVHATTHFISGGVGLRQICDWVRLVHTNKADIDRGELRSIISKTKYMCSAGAFAALAVGYLGLPEEDCPVTINQVDRRYASMLLEDVLQTGNFGQHDERRDRRPAGYWQTRCRNYIRSIRRSWKFRPVFPSEAGWYAVTTVIIWTGIQLKKMKKKVS